MNRKIKWILALGTAVVLVAAIVPWTLSSDALRRELAAQVDSATGFATHAEGRATFALLPRPRIKFENVTFTAPDAAVSLQASMIKGDLRILPLLMGRLELSSITLFSPDVSIDLDKAVHFAGAIGDATKPGRTVTAVNSARLGIVSIVSGTAHLESAARGRQTVFKDIDATLDWRSLAAPATLNGTAIWRGANADLALWINKPAALLRGDQSPIDLKIDLPAGSLTMDGSLASRPSLQYEGRIAAHAPLLRETMQLFNVAVPLPGPLRDARLTAEGKIDQNSMALTDLHISLDGNAFEGSLAMHNDEGRVAWSGTLATDLFALSPFVSDLAPAVTPDSQWNRVPIDAANLDFGDLDLRLSASRAHFGRMLLENAGFSIMLTNGKLEVTLADAKAYGGTLKGRADIAHSTAGLDLRLAANFSHVDSAAFLSDVLHSAHVSGDANGHITLEGHGDSLADIMHSLDGRGQLKLADGEVSGLDLEQALRRVEKRPLSIASEVRTGRTSFTSASGAFNVSDGNAEMEQCVASGPGVELAMTGSSEIGDRSLDLHVVAHQTGTVATNADAPQLHLDLMGSWDDPLLVLDTASLIRRSQVAAPLLRSLAPASIPSGTPASTALGAPSASAAPTR